MANKERVKKLVDALRSGEIKQTRGALNVEGRMCCLGVACEVFRRETGQGEWKNSMGCNGFGIGTTEYNTFLLPPSVREWFGFTGSNPEIYGGETTEYLDQSAAYFNDSLQESFDSIATRFEKRYLKD